MIADSADRRPAPTKALSVRQPWAELILSGRKRIEVRTWSDPYRGPLWLHVGRKVEEDAARYFGLSGFFAGGFAGVVTLVDIIPFTGDRWEKWRPQHCVPGPAPQDVFAWILGEPRRLTQPLPAAGKLGLFDVDEGMIHQLRERLGLGDS